MKRGLVIGIIIGISLISIFLLFTFFRNGVLFSDDEFDDCMMIGGLWCDSEFECVDGELFSDGDKHCCIGGCVDSIDGSEDIPSEDSSSSNQCEDEGGRCDDVCDLSIERYGPNSYCNTPFYCCLPKGPTEEVPSPEDDSYPEEGDGPVECVTECVGVSQNSDGTWTDCGVGKITAFGFCPDDVAGNNYLCCDKDLEYWCDEPDNELEGCYEPMDFFGIALNPCPNYWNKNDKICDDGDQCCEYGYLGDGTLW